MVVCQGDTLVVPKLDRLARSVPDAREIADALQARGVKLALGSSLYDPADPMGKMFFNVLATFADFEGDLIRLRTHEGMTIARAKGKLRGKQPKLSDKQQRNYARCMKQDSTQSVTLPSYFQYHGLQFTGYFHAVMERESTRINIRNRIKIIDNKVFWDGKHSYR